jgi:vacuolar-type H+-ATPase subunit E/Vma4
MKALEEDLKEVDDDPQYTDIEDKAYNVIEEITDQNITEPYLQQIYLGNTDEAIKELHIVR